MSYILHIETATKVCSVALSLKGEVIALKESLDDRYAHGEMLNLFIQDVLRETNVSLKDLSAVSVTSGPGSYTGLRIGASTAKALCYALEIPLIAVDALHSLCEVARASHPHDNLCALIDARRMEVYNILVDANDNDLKEITADVIDENSYREFEPFVYFGDGAEKLNAIWSSRNCKMDATIYSSAKGQVALAWKAWKENKFEDVAYWEPFYLKDFVAGKKNPA